jgi:hypothetical protein
VRHNLQLLVELTHWANVYRLRILDSDAMVKIGNYVPYILHLHNRIKNILNLVMLKSLEDQDKQKQQGYDTAKKFKVVE